MRLTFTAFGLTLDLELGPTPDEDDDTVTAVSYPVGFVRDEAAPWEDAGRDYGYDE